MEVDLITDLLASNPAWLAPFPITMGIEYYVDHLKKHAGRGDLLVCNQDLTHFLVVEVKALPKNLKSRNNRKDRLLHRKDRLMQQMVTYRDHMKWKAPSATVDCAAVMGDRLVAYRRDNFRGDASMFFTPPFQEAWRPAMILKPRPKSHMRIKPPVVAGPRLLVPSLLFQCRQTGAKQAQVLHKRNPLSSWVVHCAQCNAARQHLARLPR